MSGVCLVVGGASREVWATGLRLWFLFFTSGWDRLINVQVLVEAKAWFLIALEFHRALFIRQFPQTRSRASI